MRIRHDRFIVHDGFFGPMAMARTVATVIVEIAAKAAIATSGEAVIETKTITANAQSRILMSQNIGSTGLVSKT